MNDIESRPDRPRAKYGVDGDYRIVPAPVVGALFVLVWLSIIAFAVTNFGNGNIVNGAVFSGVSLVLLGGGLFAMYATRVGKFAVWGEVLTGLELRGDERVLDMGCGRGAVLLAVAKLLPGGTAVGVDLWRADQTGNSRDATLHNAEVEGVSDRVEVRTGDMAALPLEDGSVDVIVSSLAVHNIPGMDGRLAAIDEAVRVLRPGGELAIADIGFTKAYARRLGERGMTEVRQRDLGWRMWWGGPWLSTRLVTATKPA